MGFISKLLGRDEKQDEQRAATYRETYLNSMGFQHVGMQSDTGVKVNESVALTASAVWAAVQLIASAVAALPVHVMHRKDGGKDHEHAVAHLLAHEPNEYMTAPVFREALILSTLLWGNGYAAVEKDDLGRPTALLPLPSNVTRAVRINGQVVYQTTLGGRSYTLRADQVFHIMGMSFDGIMGLPPIQYHAQTVGLSLATAKFASKFFSNAGNLGGILSTPPMSDEALKKFAADWRTKNVGLDNAMRVGVLPDGYKFTPTATDPEKGQMLATRVFQIREIARIYRVPAHMLGDTEKASYASLEVQSAEFYTQCLQPWLVKFEAEANRKLLLEVEKPALEVKFNMDSQLRATTRERYAAHQTGIQGGFLTINEARAKEGLPPVDGGDDLLRPLNLGPVKPGSGGAANQQPPANAAARSLLEDTARRYLMKEIRAIQRAAKKNAGKPDEFRAWAADFYAKHKALVAGTVAAPFSAASIDAQPDEYANQHCEENRAAIIDAFTTGNIDDVLETWEAMRPHDIAAQLLTPRAA
jgi:HK97 family phage portal protein